MAQPTATDGILPTSTKGDLLVHNGTGNARLAVGANGEVLTADSTAEAGVKWAPGGEGAGAPTDATYVTLTTNATLSQERTLAGEASTISITDGGAGAAVTVGIAADGVTDAKLRNSAATSVIGRSANSVGDPADISTSTDGQVLRRSGGTLGFGAVDLADADAVTGALPIANGGTGQTSQTAAFDALGPGTTKGDIIVHNGTDHVRLAVGSNNQVLTADSGQANGVKWAAAGGAAWTTIIKPGDTTRNNNSLSADPDLQFAMNASTNYVVRGRVFFDTVAAADFKWRHAGPGSPTLVRIKRSWTIPGGTSYAGIAIDTAFSGSDLSLTGTGTNGGWIDFEGVVKVGGSSGTFSFSWAQNTTDAGNTTVLEGSWLEWAVT